MAIAERCQYRLKQADIHNFLAQQYLDVDHFDDAKRHAEKARENAWCDDPPNTYQSVLDESDRLRELIGDQ